MHGILQLPKQNHLKFDNAVKKYLDEIQLENI